VISICRLSQLAVLIADLDQHLVLGLAQAVSDCSIVLLLSDISWLFRPQSNGSHVNRKLHRGVRWQQPDVYWRHEADSKTESVCTPTS
jgi:hypothetical protein